MTDSFLSENDLEIVLPDLPIPSSGVDEVVVGLDGEDRFDVGSGQQDPFVGRQVVPDTRSVLK